MSANYSLAMTEATEALDLLSEAIRLSGAKVYLNNTSKTEATINLRAEVYMDPSGFHGVPYQGIVKLSCGGFEVETFDARLSVQYPAVALASVWHALQAKGLKPILPEVKP